MNLTPQQKSICEHVINVFETGSVAGDYSAIALFADGPHGERQVTYGRSQTTEYGNLRELVQMYVDAPLDSCLRTGHQLHRLCSFLESRGSRCR